MLWKRIAEHPKTFALICETGEEISDNLKQFAIEKELAGSSFKAIGTLSYAELGWFNWDTKKYQIAAKFEEQVELLSLIGDIGIKDGEPQIHAHLVVGRSDGSAHGGHLLKAYVSPTCELILTETPEQMQKQIDPNSGIALIRF